MTEDVDNGFEPKRSWWQIHLPSVMALIVVSTALCSWLLNVTGCKRPLFQLHLSTGILLMFVAAGILALNFVERRVDWSSGEMHAITYGWPMTAYSLLESPEGVRWRYVRPWDTESVCYNMAIAALVLYLAFKTSEWLIRRRERKHP